jgi:predicted cobalt transporter CbtA
MKYAVTILTCLALASELPEMAAMTHTEIGIHALAFGHALRSTTASLFQIPQPVWLIAMGIVLIALSWLVRRRASRSASRSSR